MRYVVCTISLMDDDFAYIQLPKENGRPPFICEKYGRSTQPYLAPWLPFSQHISSVLVKCQDTVASHVKLQPGIDVRHEPQLTILEDVICAGIPVQP